MKRFFYFVQYTEHPTENTPRTLSETPPHTPKINVTPNSDISLTRSYENIFTTTTQMIPLFKG